MRKRNEWIRLLVGCIYESVLTPSIQGFHKNLPFQGVRENATASAETNNGHRLNTSQIGISSFRLRHPNSTEASVVPLSDRLD